MIDQVTYKYCFLFSVYISLAVLGILFMRVIKKIIYKKLIKREFEYIELLIKKKLKFYNFLLQVFKF